MAELALDDDQRHALAGHLDRVRVAELVWREPPPHAGLASDAAQLGAGGGGFVLLTSRASHELVLKCALAGIELVAAVSGATSLAARLATDCNLTLVGFTRTGRHVVYSCPARLEPKQP